MSKHSSKLGISFDLYTHTHTQNHTEVTQDFFLKLLEKGYIYKDKVLQAWCPNCQRYLTDRYIEGTCPYCQFTEARGDQCDQCGKPMNPVDLVNARCKLCGGTPEFKYSEHFFLKLSAFQEQADRMGQTERLTGARTFTISPCITLKKGSKTGRSPGTWNGACRFRCRAMKVSGFTSGSMRSSAICLPLKNGLNYTGDSEKWRLFWQDGATKSYYFIGKDNIVFHSIIWPAMLMGYGGLNLPYDVPANEFLTFEEKKFSTSRNWAVWVPDYLSRYAPDPLRYLMSINMPETTDTDFSWREYYRRNNDELVATFGNLAHRVLTFTYKNYDGRIPTPGNLDTQSQALINKCRETLAEMDACFCAQCKFKDSHQSSDELWRRRPTATWMIKRPGKRSNRIKPPLAPLFMLRSQSCLV